MKHPRIAVSVLYSTPTGLAYVAPNGTFFHPHRIGEVRNGIVVSRPELTPEECERFGLPPGPGKQKDTDR